MKTLSLKVLGCAAALALLTNARAQDDVQAVPPPDTNVEADAAPAQQQAPPPVIIMQVPAEGATNGDANNEAPPDNEPGMQPLQSQPAQNAQPNQFRYNQAQGGQNRFTNGSNYDRGGRTRCNGGFGKRGDCSGQRNAINSTPVGDPCFFLLFFGAGTNVTDGLILIFCVVLFV